jgi:hypothetical protein
MDGWLLDAESVDFTLWILYSFLGVDDSVGGILIHSRKTSWFLCAIAQGSHKEENFTQWNFRPGLFPPLLC